jgi:hypothetical protein
VDRQARPADLVEKDPKADSGCRLSRPLRLPD